MKNSLALLSLLVLATSASSATAQTVSTDPVGFVSVTVPAQSDAVLAVPLNRTAAFKGVIQSISGNIITVAGTPNWTANQFVQNIGTQNDTFAIQLATGTKEGLIAKVTQNGTNNLTIQLDAGDDLTGVKTEAADGAGQGDQLDVMPYWTPSTLFGGATIAQGTQILTYSGAQGTNLSSTGSLGFDSGSWYDENTFDLADHSSMPFGSAFILRNPSGSALTVSMVGSVPMNKHRTRLVIPSGADQDVMIGFLAPIPQAIGNVALGFTEDDQLLVFNNAASGMNKSSSQILYYTTSDGWVDDSFQPVGSTFMLQPGQGYIFRKKSSGPTTIVWTALQSYLQ